MRKSFTSNDEKGAFQGVEDTVRALIFLARCFATEYKGELLVVHVDSLSTALKHTSLQSYESSYVEPHELGKNGRYPWVRQCQHSGKPDLSKLPLCIYIIHNGELSLVRSLNNEGW